MLGLFKKKTVETNNNIATPVDGQFVRMEDVPDPVFAQKIMGEGFAVKPSSETVYSPVCGTVSSVFPTKHAIGLTLTNGKNLIVHMGVDTVSLNGAPFQLFVKEGDVVSQATKLAKVDLTLLAQEEREDVIIVAFPEHGADELKLGDFAALKAGDVIGQL